VYSTKAIGNTWHNSVLLVLKSILGSELVEQKNEIIDHATWQIKIDK